MTSHKSPMLMGCLSLVLLQPHELDILAARDAFRVSGMTASYWCIQAC